MLIRAAVKKSGVKQFERRLFAAIWMETGYMCLLECGHKTECSEDSLRPRRVCLECLRAAHEERKNAT